MTDTNSVLGLRLAQEVLIVRPAAASDATKAGGIILADKASRTLRTGQVLARTQADLDLVNLQAAVNGSHVLSFVGGLTAGDKVDVLNSVQFAQRAASAAYNRNTAVEQWYESLTDTMGRLGWVGQGLAFSRQTAAHGTLTMDRAALDVIATIATGNQLAILVKAIDALRALPEEDAAFTLFRHLTEQSTNGSFQLGAVQKSTDGTLAMAMGGFYFHARTQQTRALSWDWGGDDVAFWVAAQVMTFNSGHYARLRDTVAERLGDAAADYVAALPLSDQPPSGPQLVARRA